MTQSADFLAAILAAQRATEERERLEAQERGVSVADVRAEREAHEAAQERARRDEERRSRIVARLRPYLDRIATHVVDALLSGEPRRTAALDAVQEHIESGTRPILVLSGGTGTGKTTASAAALCSVERDRAEYVHASELSRRWEPWKADRDAGIQPIRMDARLLVVDDLGAERGDDPRTMEAVCDVVDRRIGYALDGDRLVRRATIITTNLKPAELRARYGERVSSRLAEHARLVPLGDVDMRRAKR